MNQTRLFPLPIAAAGVLMLLTACQKPDERKAAIAVAPAPVVENQEPVQAAGTLLPDQVGAAAFQAAWGRLPPATYARPNAEDGQPPVTYSESSLVPLGGDRFALISSGQGGDSHVDAGALAIHYLTRTATGFTRTGAWPDFVVDGSFGAPPQWKLRTDLTAGPAIVTTGGGTWQGYTCGWSNVVELTPERPVMRTESIPIEYDSGGAVETGAETLKGVLMPDRKGASFTVRYSGDRTANVGYVLQSDTYKATSSPDLPTC